MNTNITFEHTTAKSGTHLQGNFRATYDELVKVFGEPTYMAERDGGFDKVWTEWNLEFKVPTDDDDFDYVTATIYDWKEDGPYASRTGKPYTWHIGGFDWRAENAVGDVFEASVKEPMYA